ncbi:RDD family protein [Microbacterium dextranolyticum]|uniref:FHA domain-containing protein n=1 Tax=Microbacterium dextranolyticum TaxID=36806 RepID=A0A9W6HM48_9MICO|nr:RDD family protein [Microbacterium dextranolyticum]MBM7464302.1 putative RDD family membrane protein YckC [Microbacterium dextranolyticum]GLJ95299.1 hypothetical protein GCM10017591_13610 [Microbacterium dextranolyticum]
MTDLDLGRRPARTGRRVGAYLIDLVIGVVVLMLGAAVFGGVSYATNGALPLVVAGLLAYAVGIVWFVVYTLLQAGAGSLGMRALGLRLAREDATGGERLGFGRALGRNVVWALGGAIVVGYFSPLFDAAPWHRGWHDRAARAVMTDVAGRPAPLEDDDHDRVASSSPPVAAVAPSVLPAAPNLPTGDLPDLDNWTPAAAAPSRPSPLASGVISFVPGVSDAERVDEPAPEPPAGLPTVDAPARPAPSAVPVSGALPLVEGIDETRLSTGERPCARLVWDDGTRQAVYGRTLFGRNPAPETGAMVSPVRDETLSLSKTHFELVPDAVGAVWVIDRHSTNGVALRRDGVVEELVPGERTRVHRGDVLEFGDRQVTVEVTS